MLEAPCKSKSNRVNLPFAKCKSDKETHYSADTLVFKRIAVERKTFLTKQCHSLEHPLLPEALCQLRLHRQMRARPRRIVAHAPTNLMKGISDFHTS